MPISDDVLRVNASGGGLDNTLRDVTDQKGGVSALALSKGAAKITNREPNSITLDIVGPQTPLNYVFRVGTFDGFDLLLLAPDGSLAVNGNATFITVGAQTLNVLGVIQATAGEVNTLGFFGAPQVEQQVGEPATAGGTYGATEQGMIQRMYDALRAYGLLT